MFSRGAITTPVPVLTSHQEPNGDRPASDGRDDDGGRGSGVLAGFVVMTGATLDWFAGVGVAASILWFADRPLPPAVCG